MKKELTERQKTILTFIEEYIEANGFPPTLREIGKHFEIASTNGVKRHIDALVKKGYLHVGSNASRAISVVGSKQELTEEVQENLIPLVGRVAAGYPILAEQNIETMVSIDPSFVKVLPGMFALKVRGDSMINAGIFEGDLVVVAPEKSARNNQIVVAMLGDEATLKTFVKQGGSIYLRPENDNYPLIDVNNREDFTIIGVVRAVMRFYN